MISISLRVGAARFDAVIGSNLIAEVGDMIRKVIPPSRCAVITDTNIEPRLGPKIKQALHNSDFEPVVIRIPPGEPSKNLNQVNAICEEMIAAGLDRQAFVIGLGGGVIGDISGFVASIYQRGIPHIQIPTTLLAMVDSSIGGKTGVNTAAGKNLIGAVHQPILVIDDVDVLKTLSPHEFKQGFAEIIKHAIIADAGMFQQLKMDSPASFRNGGEILSDLIRRNVEIKSAIVAEDERDRTGRRALLNFGHTIGHAIERAGGYRQFLHGEAISLGIVAACTVSMQRAGLSRDDRDAVTNLLERFDLPTRLPADFPKREILEAIPSDKKFERGQIRFVLTPKIGTAYLSGDVTMDDIRDAIEAL